MRRRLYGMAAAPSSIWQARAHIERALRLLDAELTPLVGESYQRAYRLMVSLQQLAELEEMLPY